VIEFLLAANEKQWLQKNHDEALEIFQAWHGHPKDLGNVRPALKTTIEKLGRQRQQKPGPAWIKDAIRDDIKRPLSYWRRELEKQGSRWIPPVRDLRFPSFKLVKNH
jgi:hypothetical protein